VQLLREGRWAFLAAALFYLEAWGQEPCKACHGPDGNSVIQGIPSIAGQPKLFIETQLVLMREEIRPAPQMAPLVKGMPDKEIVRLAEHFSKLSAKSVAAGPANPALVKRGQELGKKLRCGVCHLSDFSGQNQVPRLAGQREEYLDAEMRAYRDNQRRGGDTIMAATLYGVSDADISALAHYLARSTSPARAR
jgi:cytochrome c553